VEDKVLEKKEGWQMNVEIYEDYVIKSPKNKEQMRKKIEKHLIKKNQLYLLDEKINFIHSSISNSLKIIDDSNVPMKLLANATIKNGVIKQDKVVLVKERLYELMAKGEIIKAKKIIDKVIDFIIELWKYKIHENTYKFYSSYGIDSNEEVVLVDFLEITNDAESVKKQIGKKKWDKPKRYFGKVERELREYFINLSNKKLTIDTFRKYWGKRL